jgi:hypothetical protein
MTKVHAMLAAAVLGVSTMALPARAADDFKKTTIDNIPREARDAIRDKTKDKQDVQVFTRRMSDGETQYTTFFMDDGRRMEMRVDKDGNVVSPAHETRVQPGDKDADKNDDKNKSGAKNDSKRDDNKNDDTADADVARTKDWKREPEPLKNLPENVQATMKKELEAAGSKDGDYFRLRRDGDDTFSMFFAPEGGKRQELRVDKKGDVIGRYGPQGEGLPLDRTAAAKAVAEDEAAQSAGARQTGNTSSNSKTTSAQPSETKTAPKPAADSTVAPKPDTASEKFTEIKQDDLPDPVRKAFAIPTKDAAQVQYRSWTRDGKTYYSAFYFPKGTAKQMELRMDADGKALEEAHPAEAK